MNFIVTRSARGLIRPAAPTPTGTLNLSVIDRLPVLRCRVMTLHVFRHGHEPAKVIKEALSSALIHYYPLAGRLKESDQGDLQIACTGDGVWFVEAFADCSLEVTNYFDDNILPVKCNELLPDDPPKSDNIDPLVLMQVTRFTCDGFVVGLKFCHSICDGLGAAQFLNAVGDLARGLQIPKLAPVWQREALPTPQRLACAAGKPPPPPPPPPMPDYQLEHACIDISLDQINRLKHEFLELRGRTCSTFEVVAATFWSRRTQAANFEKNTDVKLVFFANCRHLLHPPLPEGFYGNCFFPVTITVSSGAIIQASISEVVKLIQEAKARLPSEIDKWLTGDDADDGDDPFVLPTGYTSLLISEWGRLGLTQIDYGWGLPVHIIPVPLPGSSIMPAGIMGSIPAPQKGIRLMTWCLKETHLPPFLDLMKEPSKNSH